VFAKRPTRLRAVAAVARSAASALENAAIGAGAAQDDCGCRRSSPRTLRSVELLISDQATPDRLLDLNL
jgi:hypothetical protein